MANTPSVDLDVACGGENKFLITWYNTTPARISLAGYTAALLKIRETGTDTVLLTLTLTPTAGGSDINLESDTTQNEDYGEGAPSSVGVVTIYISATDSATLSGTLARYDLILTPAGGAAQNQKVCSGTVNLDEFISRA